MSGGLEVALMADLRIAARSAKLGLTDAELGFSPTGGLTYLLNHIVGAGWALHLAMTAQMMTAEEALRIGLVTAVVEDHELESHVLSLAGRVGSYPTTGMKNIKRSFLRRKPIRGRRKREIEQRAAHWIWELETADGSDDTLWTRLQAEDPRHQSIYRRVERGWRLGLAVLGSMTPPLRRH